MNNVIPKTPKQGDYEITDERCFVSIFFDFPLDRHCRSLRGMIMVKVAAPGPDTSAIGVPWAKEGFRTA